MTEQLKLAGESEPEKELVRNRNGKGERIVFRKHGMFARRVQEDLSLEAIQAATVARLTDEDEDGQSPYEKAVDNVAKNAAIDAEQPVLDKFGNVVMVDGRPLTVVCPKTMMASAKSLDSVARLMGLPKKEAQQQFDIKIVQLGDETFKMLMERQGGMLQEDSPRHPQKPSFIEAEEVYTNPPIKPAPSQPVGRTQPTRKESADVESLYRDNEAKITELTQGVPMSAVIAKAENDLPVRINSRGTVLQGWLKVAAASIRNQNVIEILVEQE